MKNTLEACVKLTQRLNAVKKAVHSEDLFDAEISNLIDAILDDLHVPKDTSNKYSYEKIVQFCETKKFPKGYYCRDIVFEKVMDALDTGKPSVDKLLKELAMEKSK